MSSAICPATRSCKYATAGIRGLSIYSREALGIHDTETHLTGNVGGGVKWFAPNGRWGLRGDYGFLMTGNDNSSAFFGSDNRHAHRIYGAVIIAVKYGVGGGAVSRATLIRSPKALLRKGPQPTR